MADLDSADCRTAFCYQRRTAINQTAVYLYQCRAGVDFFGGVRATQNATHTDDGQRALQFSSKLTDHAGGLVAHGCAAQAAAFFTMRQVFHTLARQRGVGGDNAYGCDTNR